MKMPYIDSKFKDKKGGLQSKASIPPRRPAGNREPEEESKHSDVQQIEEPRQHPQNQLGTTKKRVPTTILGSGFGARREDLPSNIGAASMSRTASINDGHNPVRGDLNARQRAPEVEPRVE